MSFQVERQTLEFERAPRVGRACQSCHDRKVRCDGSSSKPQCTNCQRDGQPCKPRMRQRRSKRTTQLPANEQASSHGLLTGMPAESSVLNHNTDQVRRSYATQSVRVEANRTRENHSGRLTTFERLDVTNANESGFLGRSSYIAPDRFRDEDGSEVLYSTQTSSETSNKILDLQRALELPPRVIRDGLFDNFWLYCYPWDPIIEKSQVTNTLVERQSPLLLQAIFLAGSRMSSGSASYFTPQEFYNRAKTLFYLNFEQDPLTLLSAVSLLHWWNPHGPERISTDTSTFWCKLAVSLAQQIGLHKQRMNIHDGPRRRKLWWSLVSRDCLIGLAHGRPQAINPDDCDVPRLTVNDFPDSTATGLVFIAYVELSLILGRFTANELRKVPSRLHQADIVDSLYRWVKTLPDSICLWTRRHDAAPDQYLQSYNLQCRQLYILYLVSLILLYRPRTVDGPFPAAAVIAASLVASAFEELLVRDEVRLLGPVFTFYLLVAAIALLSCYKYPDIWTVAEEDIKIIKHAQQELLKKWPSALGSIRSFERMYKLATTTPKSALNPPRVRLTREQAVFFQDVDINGCRMWGILQEVDLCGDYDTLNACGPETPQQLATANVTAPNMSVPHQPTNEALQDETSPEEKSGNEERCSESMQVGSSIGDWLFWEQLQLDFE